MPPTENVTYTPQKEVYDIIFKLIRIIIIFRDNLYHILSIYITQFYRYISLYFITYYYI